MLNVSIQMTIPEMKCIYWSRIRKCSQSTPECSKKRLFETKNCDEKIRWFRWQKSIWESHKTVHKNQFTKLKRFLQFFLQNRVIDASDSREVSYFIVCSVVKEEILQVRLYQTSIAIWPSVFQPKPWIIHHPNYIIKSVVLSKKIPNLSQSLDKRFENLYNLKIGVHCRSENYHKIENWTQVLII